MTRIMSCRMSGIRTLALTFAFTFIALAASLPLVSAHEYKLGDLHIDHPWARATPGAAKVGGGYLTVTNNGTEADRLVSGSATFADKVEFHEMKTDGGTMVMRPVEGGIEVPAGETVELKPGGLHVMFMGLSEQLVEGEKRKVTLTFEKAGDVEVEFSVDKIGAKEPGGMEHDHGKMGYGTMNHDAEGHESMDHSGHGKSN
ncbi:copper chaperone PCu(A)C [Tepidamorphus sp. 3E244]|uniref:copper chaperone PCu(A)C n=1 Tax=Tepidamorphus sp. 3E244 TaxID=3385498 RepID=UPI0038FBFB68